MDGWQIERIDLEVPPGPSFQMGFQLYNNGVAWIPYGGSEWLIWDDARDSYYLTDQPTASGWEIVGYNDGYYDHSLTVRFHVNPLTSSPTDISPPPTVAIVTTPATVEPVTL